MCQWKGPAGGYHMWRKSAEDLAEIIELNNVVSNKNIIYIQR